MKKKFYRDCLRKIVSIILSLVMIITLLPLTGWVTFAAENDVNDQLSTSTAILNAEKEKPIQFDDMVAAGDVYGEGDNNFLLSEQNELYLYWSSKSEVKGYYYDNLDMKIVSEEDGYSWVESINAENSGANAAKDMSKIGNGDSGYRYVRGTSFDATGSGRKEYAAYVGCKNDAVYCFVQEPVTGEFIQ